MLATFKENDFFDYDVLRVHAFAQQKFSSADGLKGSLNQGDVVFGKRPLDVGNLVDTVSVDGFEAPLGNVLNIEPLHEQAFFLDADGNLVNRGFFSTNGGRVGNDLGFPGNIESYKFGPVFHNQNINSINFAPRGFGSGDYRLFGNNCQNYCSAIRSQFK